MAKIERLDLKKIKGTAHGTAVERVKAADAVIEGTWKANLRYALAAVECLDIQLDAAVALVGQQHAQIALLELQIARFKRRDRVRRARG